jgi:hypothetical protein
MKKRVLITGANGFDEDHLIAAAPAWDQGVLAAVRTGNSIQYPEESDIPYTSPDLRDVNLFSNGSADKHAHYSISASDIIRVKTEYKYDRVNTGDAKNPVTAVVPVSAKPGEFIFVSSRTATMPLTNTGFSGVTKGQYNVSEKYIYDHYAGSEGLNKTLHEKTLKFHFPVSVVLVIGTNKMNGFKQPKIKYKI